MFKLFKKRKPEPAVEQKCRCMTAENGIVVEMELIEKRPFYDTTWLITITTEGKTTSAHIVRSDDETFQTLDESIRALPDFSVDSIATLDQKSKIYYD